MIATIPILLALILAAPQAEAASAWVLWIETTEWIEPADIRGVLRGEGFRGKKWWDREATVWDTLIACDLALRMQIGSRVKSYQRMGFTVVRDDEDGPSKFVRSGLPGSGWCGDRACVIAGSSARTNPDGRERLTHHSLSCLPDTVDPRGVKGGSR